MIASLSFFKAGNAGRCDTLLEAWFDIHDSTCFYKCDILVRLLPDTLHDVIISFEIHAGFRDFLFVNLKLGAVTPRLSSSCSSC